MAPRDVAEARQLLGLAANAGESEIRAAHRREALRWHPDVNKSSAAAARFAEVQAAYELLLKPGAAGAAGRSRPHASEWARATQHSGGHWREQYAAGGAGDWSRQDMSGRARESASQAFGRRFGQSLAGAAVGGLVLLLLAYDATAKPEPRPTPDRMSRAAADSFGLEYRPPRLSGRSEAQNRWNETLLGRATDASRSATADALRAADAAAAAEEAASRSRRAAEKAEAARTPGKLAAAAAEAASASDRARRARQAAEYAAACAVVAAGPPEPDPPGVLFGAKAAAAAASRPAAPGCLQAEA